MYKLVCISGMTGSGKTQVSNFFIKRGYQFVRFGQIVLDEVKNLGLPPTESNEKKIRENFRKKYGMEAMAKLNYPKFKKLITKANIVADGLYSWSEYKYLKTKFGNKMVVVAIFAPPSLRYKRLSQRFTQSQDKDLQMRPLTPKDAKARDYAEIENIEKGGPIAMADYTILNTKDQKFLLKQLKEVQIDLNNKLS